MPFVANGQPTTTALVASLLTSNELHIYLRINAIYTRVPAQ